MARPVVGIIGNMTLLNEHYPVHAGGTMNSTAVADVAGCLPLIIPTDPRFVSVEMNDGREGEVLAACGYEVGQIVNQWMHPFKQSPNPPREGTYAPAQFTGEMSGLFGLELPPGKWLPIGDIDAIYRPWKDLRDPNEELPPG